MNREIKFRVWDDYYKGMEYIDDLYWFEENFIHDNSEINIMQYIGIKDKDDVEIYEGDKVIVPAGYGGDSFYKTTESIVVWEECEFVLDPFVWQDFCWYELKVIGNIYEKE